MHWGNSERTFGVVIPAKGDLAWVTPAFEEERARELIKFSNDVRVWQEDESPFQVIAGILKDRGVTNGKVGMEERVRFFIADGVRQRLPSAQYVIATPVTAGCRMIKSSVRDRADAARERNNASGHRGDIEGAQAGHVAARRVGERRLRDAAARRHERRRARHLRQVHRVSARKQSSRRRCARETSCSSTRVAPWTANVSDITRTTVFGKPTQRQRDVWEVEKRAQAAAFNAAQVGAACESVDAAARKVITDAGFGPGYKVPGLPHRTGHGIGLDGHEWTNFVKGNTTKIQPGMCFSDEPTIAIYGEFGIRLEDCLHITESGPQMFTPRSPSIERPV